MYLQNPHGHAIELPPSPQHKSAPDPVDQKAIGSILIRRCEDSDNPAHCVTFGSDHLAFEMVR